VINPNLTIASIQYIEQSKPCMIFILFSILFSILFPFPLQGNHSIRKNKKQEDAKKYFAGGETNKNKKTFLKLPGYRQAWPMAR
jgi:hypothetical protein